MRLLFTFMLVQWSFFIKAQDINPEYPDPVLDSNSIFQSIDTMPEYPGGREALMKYVMQNFKYPISNIDKDSSIICGRIYLSFIVEKDGKVSDVKVLKSMPQCGVFEKEGIRVLEGIPKWKPGIWHGCRVRVRYNFPIIIDFR